MDEKRELQNSETEISGGWGKETETYGNNYILSPEEVKILQESYPDLKIRKTNLQSVAIPENSAAYSIMNNSAGWVNPDQISDMLTAKLGEISYITHEGKLFKKS